MSAEFDAMRRKVRFLLPWVAVSRKSDLYKQNPEGPRDECWSPAARSFNDGYRCRSLKMTKERVQVPYYSTHAIEQLEKAIATVRKDMPGINAMHSVAVRLLRESAKFALPNCAELIDMTQIRQVHVDMARLPYPVVALESTWLLPDGQGGDKSQGLRSSRRIALCMTLTPEIADLLPDTQEFLKEEQGGVLVLPVCWEDATNRWRLPLGGVFVPHRNEVSDYVPNEAGPVLRRVANGLVDAGLPLRQLKTFRVSPFIFLPEAFEHAAHHETCEQLAARIMDDARDEVAMMLQTCAVLNCSNVSMPEINAPKMLNKKREAKGKPPFFSYRVLQLEAPVARAGKERAGHHASPLGHLRRGHIRRLQGRTVWVRPALVNLSESAEVIPKDYALRSL